MEKDSVVIVAVWVDEKPRKTIVSPATGSGL